MIEYDDDDATVIECENMMMVERRKEELTSVKFVEKKELELPSETTLKQTIWRESRCLAMSVERHSGQELV